MVKKIQERNGRMQMTQKRVVCQIFCAIFGAIFVSVIFFFIVKNIQNTDSNINIGGDKAIIFSLLFLGIPFGSSLGLFIADILFFKFKASLLGLFLSVVLCFLFGGFGSVIILSILGNVGVFLIPILFFLASFFGYYLPKKSRRVSNSRNGVT